MKLTNLQTLLNKSEDEIKKLIIDAIDNDFSIFPEIDILQKRNIELEDQLKYYKNEIKQRDKDISLLKDNSETESLKKKLEKLQSDYQIRNEEYKQEVKNLKFNTLLEKEVLKENPKNLEAVKFLLHLDSSKYNEKENNILGLTEKLQELKKTDGYLFNLTNEIPKIEGLQPVSSNTQDININPDLAYTQKNKEVFCVGTDLYTSNLPKIKGAENWILKPKRQWFKNYSCR